MFLTIAIKTVWLDGDFVGQERYQFKNVSESVAMNWQRMIGQTLNHVDTFVSATYRVISVTAFDERHAVLVKHFGRDGSIIAWALIMPAQPLKPVTPKSKRKVKA